MGFRTSVVKGPHPRRTDQGAGEECSGAGAVPSNHFTDFFIRLNENQCLISYLPMDVQSENY